MVDLWILHIDSLRQTFGQSLTKIFQRVQEIWSGQESVTEGQTEEQTDRQRDRQTDGQTNDHFYNPPSASWPGIKKALYSICMQKNKRNKRTMMVLYRSPDQTDLHIYC